MVRRPTLGCPVFAAIVAIVVLGALSCAQAAPPATTQPDSATDFDQTELLRLARDAQGANGLRWGQPTTWMFDNNLPLAGWTITDAKITRNDDHWLIEPTGRFFLRHTLPRAAANGSAFRVDAWLRCEPADDGPVRIGFYADAGQQPGAFTNFFYDFAMNKSGNLQQIFTLGLNIVEKPADVDWNRIIHASFAVSASTMVGQRDDTPAVVARGPQAIKLTPAAWVGVGGFMKQARLYRLSVRTLEPFAAPAGNPRQADARRRLSQLLLTRVFPRLGHASYDVRQRTTELLTRLGPAAMPAIHQALETPGRFGPEVTTRLETMVAPTGLPALESIPAPDLDEAPPGYKKPPPATQPDDAG